MITYNLSPQEKNDLLLGKGVDVKGKMSTTEVTKGTFNNGQLGKSQSCGWVDETVIIECSSHEHNASNIGDWGSCTAGTPPMLYTTHQYICTSYDDGSGNGGGYGPGGPGDGGGGGDPGDGSGGGYNPPCNGTGVLTGPQNPNIDFGDTSGGCSGVPTSPNTGNNNSTDPCQKSKTTITNANNVLHNNDVKTKMDAVLRGKTEAPNEWGVALGKKTNGIEVTNAVEGIPGQNQVGIPISQLQNPFIGDGHSHKGARGNPSGGDLYKMLEGLLTQPDFKYRFVYGNDSGTPEVYALVIDNPSLALDFLSQYPESENCNNTNFDHSIKDDSPVGKEFYTATEHYSSGRSEDTSGENYEPRTVAMAHILEKFNVGMSIAKVDANGNLKKINAKIQQITVPFSGGVLKEGIKVSKCP